MISILPTSEKMANGWPWTEEVEPSEYLGTIDWPKITVITPSYNQGKFIEETIRSILLQNYPNLEYIVMDGGSSDDTVSIISKYSTWITYWESEKDKGQTHAINKGLMRASGEIFNWINSDDILEKGALKKVALAYLLNPSSSMYIGDGKIIRLDSSRKYAKEDLWKANPRLDYQSFLRKAMHGNGLSQPSIFLNYQFFLGEKLNICQKLQYCFDWELYLRILSKNPPYSLIGETISAAKQHDDAKTVNSWERFLVEALAVYKSILGTSSKRNARIVRFKIAFIKNTLLRNTLKNRPTFWNLVKFFANRARLNFYK